MFYFFRNLIFKPKPIKNKIMSVVFIEQLDQISFIDKSIKTIMSQISTDDFRENDFFKQAVINDLKDLAECFESISDDYKKDWREIKWQSLESLPHKIKSSYFDDYYFTKLKFIESKLPKLAMQVNEVLNDQIFILRSFYYRYKNLENTMDNVLYDDFNTNKVLQRATYNSLLGMGDALWKMKELSSANTVKHCAEIPWLKLNNIQSGVFVDNYGPDYETVWKASQDYLLFELDLKIEECLKKI